MKYIKEYLKDVIKVKPLGELTTEEDELDGISGEMVYIDGKCSNIFISHIDYANWLEKQSENDKSLYIRFGDIPKNEKSKVYNGEIEIGTEKGVSVYPAFEDLEGNIVLGLSLPITKTTLYTQQHLIEYDDRPCYLVTGDYIGKDTDGQPLINNVSIIEKIDTYRVKEKMQSEQKVRCTALMETGNGGIKALVTRELPINSCDDEQKPADEPKFHKGDWIVSPDNLVCKITQANSHSYTLHLYNDDYRIFDTESWHIDKKYHLWTIQDAKEGDVLATDKSVFIYAKVLYNKPYAYCGVDKFGVFKDNCLKYDWANSVDNIHPATKEQRAQLFQKMKEAGYTFDFEKKELKKVEQEQDSINPSEYINDIGGNGCYLKNAAQVSSWSKKDEKMFEYALNMIEWYSGKNEDKSRFVSDWLKSIKDRVGCEVNCTTTKEWSEEDERNMQNISLNLV